MGRKSGAFKFEKRRKELEKKKKKEEKRLARIARKEGGDGDVSDVEFGGDTGDLPSEETGSES
jgi:hypothetical protein